MDGLTVPADARKISAEQTSGIKWFAILYLAGVTLSFGLLVGIPMVLTGRFMPLLLALPAAVLFSGGIAMQFLVWGPADEAWDAGDAIIFRKGRELTRVPLADIGDVDLVFPWETLSAGSYYRRALLVKIPFLKETALGMETSFYLRRDYSPVDLPSSSSFIERLKYRAEKARKTAGA